MGPASRSFRNFPMALSDHGRSSTRAKVGKPTLYKWWPSKAALIMAMFHERLAGKLEAPKGPTKMRHLTKEFNELFGKVMADLIAGGQSNPSILKALYEGHMRLRRKSTVADIERGKGNGEFAADIDPELLIDSMFGPLFIGCSCDWVR